MLTRAKNARLDIDIGLDAAPNSGVVQLFSKITRGAAGRNSGETSEAGGSAGMERKGAHSVMNKTILTVWELRP